MRFSLDMTARGMLRHVFGAIKKIAPNIFSPKVLMCGLPMGQGRIGLANNAPLVMEAIRDTLEQLAREEKAAMVIFKDFTSASEGLFKPFLSLGYFKIETIPSTEMRVNFSSFDEYLKGSSRVSREGLKRNLYFVRFRGLLKWCIDNGIKKYEMGVTCYEPKRRLGFDFIRLYFYIKHRNPAINKIIPLLKFFFAPEYFDPVFREMNAVAQKKNQLT